MRSSAPHPGHQRGCNGEPRPGGTKRRPLSQQPHRCGFSERRRWPRPAADAALFRSHQLFALAEPRKRSPRRRGRTAIPSFQRRAATDLLRRCRSVFGRHGGSARGELRFRPAPPCPRRRRRHRLVPDPDITPPPGPPGDAVRIAGRLCGRAPAPPPACPKERGSRWSRETSSRTSCPMGTMC